jgi:hypothetical protein
MYGDILFDHGNGNAFLVSLGYAGCTLCKLFFLSRFNEPTDRKKGIAAK